MSKCTNCPEDLKEICIEHYGNDGSPNCASDIEETAPSASDNKTKTEICGKIIESSSICEYCKVRETGQTLDCEICINKSYGNFLGRKLSVIC